MISPLYGDTYVGCYPSNFVDLFAGYYACFKHMGMKLQGGIFGTQMQVQSVGTLFLKLIFFALPDSVQKWVLHG